MKILLVSPFWLPRFGGAEQYEYRLALELQKRGHQVEVICGTEKDASKFNGLIEAHRFTSNGPLDWASWSNIFTNDDKFQTNKERSDLFNHFKFFEYVIHFAKNFKPDIAILGNTLQTRSSFHARELYISLKNTGCKVGCFHYDIHDDISNILIETYKKYDCDWNIAANITKESLITISNRYTTDEFNWIFGSPVFFAPDFVISCSNWSSILIDPLALTKHFTLHPILDESISSTFSLNSHIYDMVDILMINPQSRKNPLAMAELIEISPHDMTFRILKGGWGNSFSIFKELIAETRAFKDGRIEFLDYVSDMREVYARAKLVFFPSLIEGYGQSAVEPMFVGTPVLSSNYPAILEAVGNGASLLCPYKSTSSQWLSSAMNILENHDHWISQAKKRASELISRQGDEIIELELFFNSIIQS